MTNDPTTRPVPFTAPVRGGDLAGGQWRADASGIPILALHGITATHRAWHHVADALPERRLVAPDLHAKLFPRESLPVIYCLAQIGLVLYMFLVGLEFDLELIRKRLKSAVAVSWAGIATPFALGALLAWALEDRFPLFTPQVKLWEAMLFTGSAMAMSLGVRWYCATLSGLSQMRIE